MASTNVITSASAEATPERVPSARRRDARPICPTWFVAGVLVLITGSLVLAFSQRSDPHEALVTSTDHGDPVVERQLLFVDFPNGDVGILDAADGSTMARLGIGEGGFMRSVMRGMARERRTSGHGPELPFTLTLWADGLVSIVDPATGRQIALSAFGIDNVEAFTRLL